MTDSSITVAILAGGESRRMGRDKAQITVGGLPLLERTARVALSVCASTMVVGRARPEDWPLPEVRFFEDESQGQGPLGGLATALRHSGEAVLLLACDLPALTSEALSWLLEAAEKHPSLTDGLVTINDGQREPLFSVYAASCLPLVNHHLDAGKRSLQALLNAGRFVEVVLPSPLQPALVNVNTPEEFTRWSQDGERSP